MEELDQEVIDNIKPFSGIPEAIEAFPEDRALQQVKTGYTTAVKVQQPRVFARFLSNVLQEAELAGAAFFYHWEVFDKEKGRKVPIEGASIDMGMCLARNYGNDAIECDVRETSSHYIFKATFVDLETGFTAPRLFRQRKAQRISGKMDSERQEDIVFQIGQSKAIRNAVLRALPKWVIDKAIERAKTAELNGIKKENIAMARTQVLDWFIARGVTQEQLEKERGRKVDEWVAQDILDLRGMATAIKDGNVSVKELFQKEENGGVTEEEIGAAEEKKEEEKKSEPPVAKPESLYDRLMSARSTFASLIMDPANTKEIEAFFPDQYDMVKARWENAAKKGAGGVKQGAEWPLTKKPAPQEEGGLVDAEWGDQEGNVEPGSDSEASPPEIIHSTGDISTDMNAWREYIQGVLVHLETGELQTIISDVTKKETFDWMKVASWDRAKVQKAISAYMDGKGE
ncbi:MAG: hypothetical protein ABIJ26_00285 [Candidatus Margulisiibacteriota bacterium]